MKAEKKTLIIISLQEKILELSDYILVIKNGRIEKSGSTNNIFPTLSIKSDEIGCKGCEKKKLV